MRLIIGPIKFEINKLNCPSLCAAEPERHQWKITYEKSII